MYIYIDHKKGWQERTNMSYKSSRIHGDALLGFWSSLTLRHQWQYYRCDFCIDMTELSGRYFHFSTCVESISVTSSCMCYLWVNWFLYRESRIRNLESTTKHQISILSIGIRFGKESFLTTWVLAVPPPRGILLEHLDTITAAHGHLVFVLGLVVEERDHNGFLSLGGSRTFFADFLDFCSWWYLRFFCLRTGAR